MNRYVMHHRWEDRVLTVEIIETKEDGWWVQRVDDKGDIDTVSDFFPSDDWVCVKPSSN